MSLDEHSNATDELSLFGNVDPLLGKTMGNRWEITEFLGEGSMSSVYKAQELQTGDRVVLKILHNHLVANAKSLKRFEQKARSTVNLVHPCIAHIIDIQLTGEGQVFLVVEYLKGESLEDLLAKTGHLSVEHAIDIFRQACEGLEYAHQQDIIHRDLKPSNLMLIADGAVTDEVKLVDFGVAKLLSDESDDVKSSGYITRTREVFGSPMYMSPEQCMGKRLDARSDIYSLGCVMYETLTGKPPFVGKNVLETAYKHMNEAPKSITADSVASRAMTRIESVIFKCLAKDPNERYQSMSQLRSDIDILLRASDVEWNTAALALKKSIKVKRPKEKRHSDGGGFSLSSISLPQISMSGVSFEVGVFAGACLLLITVVAVWGFSFLGSDAQEYPAFNLDHLWVITDKKEPPEVPDFGRREEAGHRELQTAENDKGLDSPEYESALDRLIHLYMKGGHWNDAVTNLEKEIEMIKRGQGPVPLYKAEINLAYSYFMCDQYAEAEKSALDGLDEAKRENLSGQPQLEMPLQILGDIYSRKNQLEKAADVYDQLYAICEPRKILAPPEFAIASIKLGDIYRRMNRLADAERLYKVGLDTTEGMNIQPTFKAKALLGLGLVLGKEGNWKEAEDQLRSAYRINKQLSEPKSGLSGAIKRTLDECIWHTNPMAALTARLSGTSPADSRPATSY